MSRPLARRRQKDRPAMGGEDMEDRSHMTSSGVDAPVPQLSFRGGTDVQRGECQGRTPVVAAFQPTF